MKSRTCNLDTLRCSSVFWKGLIRETVPTLRYAWKTRPIQIRTGCPVYFADTVISIKENKVVSRPAARRENDKPITVSLIIIILVILKKAESGSASTWNAWLGSEWKWYWSAKQKKGWYDFIRLMAATDLDLESQKATSQCCGSGMFIPGPNFFHPGSASKNFKYVF